MNSYFVPISFGSAAPGLFLRELCGADEMAVADTSPLGAIELLDRLLLDRPAAPRTGRAAELTVADRDRALAAVYSQTFGDHVATTIHCSACGAPFDLDFSLAGLRQHLCSEETNLPAEALADGYFRLPDGRRFRLPTGADEYALQGLPPEEAERALRSRCLPDDKTEEPSEDIQLVMQRMAPVMNTDLEAVCPECGQSQTLRFDLQQYLLSALLQEREMLVYEVHQLSRAYSWRLQEILELPRSIRRMYVAILEEEG